MLTITYMNENFRVLKYKPTISNPLYKPSKPLTFSDKVSLFIDYIFGYTVYYIKNNNGIIGSCIVRNGKSPRFTFANKRDIIVGPCLIDEEYKGEGFDGKLITIILNNCEKNRKNAFILVDVSNRSCIKTVKRLGARLVCLACKMGLKRMRPDANGAFGVCLVER